MTINDKEYFREIYQRNVDDIYRLCFSYLKNPHDCEDAVSAVFCKLMKKNPVFDTPQKEKASLPIVVTDDGITMAEMALHP